MTVDFNSDGRLEIRAETHTESVALKHLVAQNDAASRILIFTDLEAMVETSRAPRTGSIILSRIRKTTNQEPNDELNNKA